MQMLCQNVSQIFKTCFSSINTTALQIINNVFRPLVTHTSSHHMRSITHSTLVSFYPQTQKDSVIFITESLLIMQP